MTTCRWVFTASPGRCGTMLLAKLLGIIPGVTTQHELKPRIEDVWWRLRKEPELATQWLEAKKIPHIKRLVAQTNAHMYVDTSHLMCKGFFEAMWQMDVQFEIILLSRNAREVAKSLYDLHDVPLRTVIGRRWYLKPGDPRCISTLPDNYYSSFTNYQLCYWYVLEMALRQAHYELLCTTSDIPVYKIRLEELLQRRHFEQLLSEMRLPTLTKPQYHAYKTLTGEKHNNKNGKKHVMRRKGLVDFIIPHIDEQEEEVERVMNYKELLAKFQ